jgi:hypothetical protein
MRLMIGTTGAMALLALAPAAAQRTPVAGATTPPRVPPITQPPSATIMAEPVALFIAAYNSFATNSSPSLGNGQGEGAPAGAIPEPTLLAPLVAGLFLTTQRRRRPSVLGV